MTKESKFGLLMLVALLLLVPVMFVLIKASFGALYIIFKYPLEILIFTGGLFVGSLLTKLFK